MNSIKKTSFLLMIAVSIIVPLHTAEKKTAALTSMIKDVRTSLEQATKNTAKRISDAINTKNNISISRISISEKTKKIAEQDKIITTAEQELVKLADSAVKIADETERQASYVSKFMSGMRNFGSKSVATLKNVYYGYSEQERLLAQAVITELEDLKKKETNPIIRKQIDNEIYKHKLISGDEMSTQRKLLIGAAVAAAAVGGVMLTNYYLNKPNTPSITPSAIQVPEATPTSQEPVTAPENQTPEAAVTPVSDQPKRDTILPSSHQAKIDELISEENTINKRLSEINDYLEPINKSGLPHGEIIEPASVREAQKAYQAALDEYKNNWKQSEDVKKEYDNYRESRRKLGKYDFSSFEHWASDTWNNEGLRNAIKHGDLPLHSPESKWWDYMQDLSDERNALKTRVNNISHEINEQLNSQQEKDNKSVFSTSDQAPNKQSTIPEKVLSELPEAQQKSIVSSSEENQSRRRNKELTPDLVRKIDKLEAKIKEKKALVEQIRYEKYTTQEELNRHYNNANWGPSEERTHYLRTGADYDECYGKHTSSDNPMHDMCADLKRKKEEAEKILLDSPDGETLMISLQTTKTLYEKEKKLEKQLDNAKDELRLLQIRLNKLWSSIDVLWG